MSATATQVPIFWSKPCTLAKRSLKLWERSWRLPLQREPAAPARAPNTSFAVLSKHFFCTPSWQASPLQSVSLFIPPKCGASRFSVKRYLKGEGVKNVRVMRRAFEDLLLTTAPLVFGSRSWPPPTKSSLKQLDLDPESLCLTPVDVRFGRGFIRSKYSRCPVGPRSVSAPCPAGRPAPPLTLPGLTRRKRPHAGRSPSSGGSAFARSPGNPTLSGSWFLHLGLKRSHSVLHTSSLMHLWLYRVIKAEIKCHPEILLFPT